MAFFTYDRITQFSECDAAGVIHFSKIACFVEEAEHAFLFYAGYPIELFDPNAYCWPRVNYTASYTSPLLPFTKICVSLQPLQVGTSSVNWGWQITDLKQKNSFCEGEMKTVCCLRKNGKMETNSLPDDLRIKLLSTR